MIDLSRFCRRHRSVDRVRAERSRCGRHPLRLAFAIIISALLVSAGCATRTPGGRRPRTPSGVLEVREGLASYYGRGFEGRLTASGERFSAAAMTAAHPTYPFGTIARVVNLANGRSVRVRIQDRGPAPEIRRQGVLIDVSEAAARALRFIRAGRTRVRIEVLRWGS